MARISPEQKAYYKDIVDKFDSTFKEPHSKLIEFVKKIVDDGVDSGLFNKDFIEAKRVQDKNYIPLEAIALKGEPIKAAIAQKSITSKTEKIRGSYLYDNPLDTLTEFVLKTKRKRR